MKPQHYRRFTISTLCFLVSAFAVASTVRKSPVHAVKVARNTLELEREIQQARPDPKDPIKLTEIHVQGKQVHVQEKFLADEEWIKKTTFKLKNQYTKVVAFIQVDIDFPETATSGIMMQTQLLLGRHPLYGKPNHIPLTLKPDESLEVSLAPEFERIKSMIERRHAPIANVRQMLIRLQDIGFEDGTVYAAGAFFKQNPDTNSPRKWIRIEER